MCLLRNSWPYGLIQVYLELEIQSFSVHFSVHINSYLYNRTLTFNQCGYSQVRHSMHCYHTIFGDVLKWPRLVL